MKKTFQNVNQAELDSISKFIIENIEGDKSNLILIEGEMGAGKTTLVKKVAYSLKFEDNITSPTYNIIREYHNENINFIHIDVWNVVKLEDLESLGLEEYFKSDNIIIVEWANKFSEYFLDLGKKFNSKLIEINIEIDGEKRNITISA